MRATWIAVATTFVLFGASPALAKKKAKKKAPESTECGIVLSGYACAWACERIWRGVPPVAQPPPCPNVDQLLRSKKPKRRCGVQDGVCAFLD